MCIGSLTPVAKDFGRVESMSLSPRSENQIRVGPKPLATVTAPS